MRRLFLVLLTAFIVTLPAFAQYGAEVDAIVEGLYAKDLNAVLAHLPPEVADTFADISDSERKEISQKLPLAAALWRRGMQLAPGDTTGAILSVTDTSRQRPEPRRIDFYVDKRLTDGTETLLRVHADFFEGDSKTNTVRANVTLRFVNNEWRLYEVQSNYQSVQLDSPYGVSRFYRTHRQQRESEVEESLERLAFGVRNYEEMFEQYPLSLQQLRNPETMVSTESDAEEDTEYHEPQRDPDHAGLVSDELSAPPYESQGYRYIYRTDSSVGFMIVARPIERGVETKRSFYIDRNMLMHYTDEDREPTVADPPIQ